MDLVQGWFGRGEHQLLLRDVFGSAGRITGFVVVHEGKDIRHLDVATAS
jgi:hypothetical protein